MMQEAAEEHGRRMSEALRGLLSGGGLVWHSSEVATLPHGMGPTMAVKVSGAAWPGLVEKGREEVVGRQAWALVEKGREEVVGPNLIVAAQASEEVGRLALMDRAGEDAFEETDYATQDAHGGETQGSGGTQYE
ncbi:hypothetical protein CYMTET_29623 [Cymbomonas tetramitiformis]|uniref:Uncharacterized protein n=1 Tax=Cymbomonas tetramitiformis TaxID=36881 RepID=A0AAE0KUY9_9CHLO|nr:hypothetical protein CYMTET_29623 [Cymbomonas tetramitiformis]